MYLTDEEIQKRKEHNENAHLIPESLQRGYLKGEHVIIRLFMYEAETVKEGGLIVPRYKAGMSEGGRPIAHLSDDKYQARGVILKVGDKVEDYNVGEVVYIPIQAATDSSRYFFATERETPVSDFDGVLRIPQGIIEYVEQPKIELPDGPKAN